MLQVINSTRCIKTLTLFWLSRAYNYPPARPLTENPPDNKASWDDSSKCTGHLGNSTICCQKPSLPRITEITSAVTYNLSSFQVSAIRGTFYKRLSIFLPSVRTKGSLFCLDRPSSHTRANWKRGMKNIKLLKHWLSIFSWPGTSDNLEVPAAPPGPRRQVLAAGLTLLNTGSIMYSFSSCSFWVMCRGGWHNSVKRRRRCIRPRALSCGLHSSCLGRPMILFTMFILAGWGSTRRLLQEDHRQAGRQRRDQVEDACKHLLRVWKIKNSVYTVFSTSFNRKGRKARLILINPLTWQMVTMPLNVPTASATICIKYKTLNVKN